MVSQYTFRGGSLSKLAICGSPLPGGEGGAGSRLRNPGRAAAEGPGTH